jgi:hypothetical protein
MPFGFDPLEDPLLRFGGLDRHRRRRSAKEIAAEIGRELGKRLGDIGRYKLPGQRRVKRLDDLFK